jgi:two-component system cell cycle response regulator
MNWLIKLWRFLRRENEIASLREQVKRLTELAYTDALTGLLSRHGLEMNFRQAVGFAQRALRSKPPVAFAGFSSLIMDVDRFKQVNDTLGHATGDQVLALIANITKQVFHRDTDILCRFGGDEMLFILPNTTKSNAMKRAELFRQTVSLHPFLASHNVTVSVGVCWLAGHEALRGDANDAINRMKKLSDVALYHAKETRNSVSIV